MTLERTPDGHINNCALANGEEERDCQMCPGTCPDRYQIAFVARMEHAIGNCARHKRPYVVYDEAVAGLYAPELLRRFKSTEKDNVTLAKDAHDLAVHLRIALKALEWYASSATETYGTLPLRAKLALALIRQTAVATICEACGKNLFVIPDDRVPAVFCAECGGGSVALPREDVLSETGPSIHDHGVAPGLPADR